MKISSKGILQLLIIIVGSAVFIYLILFNRDQSKQFNRLEKEGILDTAKIIREFTGAKSKLYYEYVFFIESRKYNGFLHYSPSNGPIDIGDSCLVKYLPQDPGNYNKLLERNYKIVKINR